ncbi:hypothetical protein BDR26DRAFT_858262 [Obelidium mucronatum]|nr:hypothetical protein BDR26DRAFT_858262 [Obelidium mucronatum]
MTDFSGWNSCQADVFDMAAALPPVQFTQVPKQQPTSPKQVPKQLFDSLVRAETLSKDQPEKTLALFLGSAKSLWQIGQHQLSARALNGLIAVLAPFFKTQTQPTGITPAQVKEILFQSQFALARIMSPLDPLQCLSLYSDALSTKFKSFDVKRILERLKNPHLLITLTFESLPATEMMLSKILLHCSEASRAGLVHRFHPGGLELGIMAGTLVAGALLKTNQVTEFGIYFKYCAEMAVMLLGDWAPIGWLMEGSSQLLADAEKSNTRTGEAAVYLIRAFIVSIQINDRVLTNRLAQELQRDIFKGVSICAFASKMGEAVSVQDILWLEYEASDELTAAAGLWKIDARLGDLLPVNRYLPAGIEVASDAFIVKELQQSLALVLSRMRGG